METEAKESPALHLIRHVKEYEGHGMGHSWDRINHARCAAVVLAIRYGLQFHPDDGSQIKSICSHLSDWEQWYAIACGRDRGAFNPSAYQMIEKLLNRKPFLVRETPRDQSARRVYVGFQFEWYGEVAKCTSIDDGKKAFIACTYRKDNRLKVFRRMTLTHADIREYHAALKAYAELERQVIEQKLEKQSAKFWKQQGWPERRFALRTDEIKQLREHLKLVS